MTFNFLVNWDAGFYKWESFQANVIKIVESMKSTYDGIPLIFRPGQYYEGRKIVYFKS